MCDSKSFHEVINLGKHPLVNSLVEKRSKEKDPVSIKLNNVKNNFQLTDIIDANEIYTISTIYIFLQICLD